MTPVQIAAAVSAALVAVAFVAVAARMLRSPTTSDRVIATDMLALIGIAVAALAAVLTGHAAFIDVAFGIALLGFLAAVAFAGLIERAAAGAAQDAKEAKE